MHKRLILLGLLLAGPHSGYRLHQVVTAHGQLYRDLKKANVYYLLGRMEQDGLVTVAIEPDARGPRRERLIYTLTDAGRGEFRSLLRQVLAEYEPVHTGVEVGAVLLDHLPAEEARLLLEARRSAVAAHRDHAATELGLIEAGTAADHLIALVDAELAWLDRALARLSGQRSWPMKDHQ